MGVDNEETELEEVDEVIGIGGYGMLSEMVGVPNDSADMEV